MNPRDLFLDLDEDDAPSVYPTFRHGMKVERIQVEEIPVDYEYSEGVWVECIVVLDEGRAASVEARLGGESVALTPSQREAIVSIALRGW